MPPNQRARYDASPRRTGSQRADRSVPPAPPSSALPLPRSATGHHHLADDYNTYTTPAADDHDRRARNLLTRPGSESSLASSTSSVFSPADSKMSYSNQATSIHALTPLTSTDSSPPGKLPSPRSAHPSNETSHAVIAPSRNAPSIAALNSASAAMTPVHTPPEKRVSARPVDGKMGTRIVFDPQLDPKHRKAKTAYKEIIEKGDPSPPPDPRLALAGYTSGNYTVKTSTGISKTKLRVAPYVAKPYAYDPRISCGPGPATQVVVTGFDPLTPESQIRGFFSTFGDVESIKNQLDPEYGSPVGICLIRYRDTPGSRSLPAVKASNSAKKAEKEGTNQRIGLQAVKVQLDREGRRCVKLVERLMDQRRKEEDRARAKSAAKSATPSTPTVAGAFDLPANVPKGPSGKGMRPPVAIAPQIVSRKHQLAHLVEPDPIKSRLKRTPYIFIAKCFVPVLGTTIEHLKKRLKSYHWSSVRCDYSGYFVTFEESKRGEDETVRCFQESNMSALFTYTMNMECNQYGDPDYERSPSPERVMADKKRKAEEERILQDEQQDLEQEKKQRADQLDPVIAALDMLRQEIHEKVMHDVKTRIGGPALIKLMASERLSSKRRKLNIADPQSREDNRPPAYLGIGLNSPAPGTPNSRASGFPGRFGRKALAPYDHNRVRGKKPPGVVNAFADERRKTLVPKRNAVRSMHRMMLDLYEEKESDDEGRSSFTRDTEEQESRPISRAPSTDADEEESAQAQRAKRRRLAAGWGEDSDDDMVDDSHARGLLAHLIDKDPEHMAEMELEQVLAILPRSSPIWKKADKALKGFRRLRKIEQEADAIFGLETSADDKQEPAVIITQEEPVETVETEPVKAPKKKAAAKPKKKTKKQLLEEAKAAEVEATVLHRLEEILPDVEEAKPVQEIPESEATPEDEQSGVNWGVSLVRPRRIVEDDFSVVMDIDGWQDLLKDDEDLAFLIKALKSTPASNFGDAHSWAWKQKQIKQLNRPGEEGVSRTETKIEGYYVPNSSGSARTEGVKKIKESEKSKYLPHRIRVQKQREERERQAKAERTHNVEGFKFSSGPKTAPTTSNSRANRANNRRLVNDINTQKIASGAEGDAMRFNQLKKRKKLVKFDRSAIHNWGLYAQEAIAANDMIIEYVGEKVRQRVADLRETKYDLQGVGSSYLFRIDEDTVIDATKMGGIARFINHSCTPNCTAKIIRADGSKRIVIYALRDIDQDEELTYDYKFERELDSDNRIPCLCGSAGCKGFLN
ncbi:histone H3-K4 methyltransferase Set1 [Polyplosphaeria fusca]|uniref:Histone-lysine N-methyltransferase, H3 lysine-4 specific n=1 Tax=Polyplosphaeria fusca TaxID=682080 RepID=A0A9P4QQD9_9PLEO|nr:histone H3-K4 methyltransferase Set1 [Polyplosphaeria fusca]